MKLSVVIISILFVFTSCNDKIAKSRNKFSDSTIVKLYDALDKRESELIAPYLNDDKLLYRQASLLAFGSLQDTSYLKQLTKKLSDPDIIVRKNAAFALGQTGESHELIQSISQEGDSIVRHELFEALGKTLSGSIQTGVDVNDIGFPWFCYRYALRNVCDSVVINQVSKFLSPQYSFATRLGVAHFFARGKLNDIRSAEESVIRSALKDSAPEVRMASAAGLKNTISDSSLDALVQILTTDSDYGVRVNAARSLTSFPFEKTYTHLFHALEDSQVNVQITSAEVIASKGTADFYNEIVEQGVKVSNWRVQAILLEAAMSLANEKQREELYPKVLKIFNETINHYQKAWLLQALSYSEEAIPVISAILLTSDAPVLKSYAASALVGLDRENKFSDSTKKVFLETYTDAIDGGDAAVIGIITDALMDSTLKYKNLVSNTDFLITAKQKLSLPRDYESYVPLENAIAYFEGREPEIVEKNFNHPIDWKLVRTIPSDQLALIKTSKGDITIQLFVEEAPGSVANFVELVQRNYYDGKFFHRVAPNFVIQGGCPRGDGWGGEDYSIRSEFSGRRYTTGSVGMASAGKDTEGTQWFITHSPTPHLDGRYTIFAEVTSGMEVVHKMEVGDQILDIILLNYPVQ